MECTCSGAGAAAPAPAPGAAARSACAVAGSGVWGSAAGMGPSSLSDAGIPETAERSWILGDELGDWEEGLRDWETDVAADTWE